MNRHALGCLFELLETLVLTLVIFLVVQTFVGQPYEIQQQSMENTLMPNQYVLVDKLTPRFDQYHRGDIVVFDPPAGWARDPSGAPYIKRVIGVANDTVDIHDGHVFVNGVQIGDDYVFNHEPTRPWTEVHTWKVPDDSLFVLGDHRSSSQDSRTFGPIAKSAVIGRAWLRYWPLNQFGILPSQSGAAASASPGPSASPSISPVP